MSEFTRLCLEGDFVEAPRRQGRIQALAQACFLETNPVPVKTALALMGRIRESFRLPMVPMAPENRHRLEEILKREGFLEAALA